MQRQDIAAAGFDGFYTYFAANEFTYGSSWKHWKSLSGFARKNGTQPLEINRFFYFLFLAVIFIYSLVLKNNACFIFYS